MIFPPRSSFSGRGRAPNFERDRHAAFVVRTLAKDRIVIAIAFSGRSKPGGRNPALLRHLLGRSKGTKTMLKPTSPLNSKNPDGVLRALIIGRISTEHQNIENIEASYRYVENYLQQIYEGPVQIKLLGEQASGMLTARPSIREAEQLIESGQADLVISEDLSRIYRNPRHQYDF